MLFLHTKWHRLSTNMSALCVVCLLLSALTLSDPCNRQGVKLGGRKGQAGVGAGAEESMEDRTSSQSLVAELGNTVMLLIIHLLFVQFSSHSVLRYSPCLCYNQRAQHNAATTSTGGLPSVHSASAVKPSMSLHAALKVQHRLACCLIHTTLHGAVN